MPEERLLQKVQPHLLFILQCTRDAKAQLLSLLPLILPLSLHVRLHLQKWPLLASHRVKPQILCTM